MKVIMEFIEIDGSHGSGGGQIIRTAIAMSALTGKPCHIRNIRARRENPGLGYQHLTAVKAVAELCGAKVRGAELRSDELFFIPGNIGSGTFNFDIGTAGSITLVLQALLPAAIHAKGPIKFMITGGTNVPLAPSPEYFQHIFCDYLKKMGLIIESETIKYGFYPKGGGQMRVSIKPCIPMPLELTSRGKLLKVDCWSIATSDLQKASVAERQIEGFTKEMNMKIEKKNIVYVDSLSTGTSIHGHSHYENCKLGSDVLGERGLKAEEVGRKCAESLKKEMDAGGCVDSHCIDQLLPFMAFAGKGRILANEITEHAKTNAHIIQKFLPVLFNISGKIIEVEKL
jgi:RNA 3'-phosphate cyclase